MKQKRLLDALELLREQYRQLNWTCHDFIIEEWEEKIYRWPAPQEDNITVVVHRSHGMQETFHRHDFFYFNYTYRGEYDCLSSKYGDKLTIQTGEIYAGQPFAGHALCVHDDQETVIIGVLIRRDYFFRAFLPELSSNSKLFHFFLDPASNSFSEEYIHFKIPDDCAVRSLLELMVVEYARKRPDTQELLKPLTMAFLVQIVRQYALSQQVPCSENLSERIVQYMREHFDSVSLKGIAEHFSYHPNYISALLRKETGKTFSQFLLEQRMERAVIFLRETDLPVQEIAARLGYSNSSNF